MLQSSSLSDIILQNTVWQTWMPTERPRSPPEKLEYFLLLVLFRKRREIHLDWVVAAYITVYLHAFNANSLKELCKSNNNKNTPSKYLLNAICLAQCLELHAGFERSVNNLTAACTSKGIDIETYIFADAQKLD